MEKIINAFMDEFQKNIPPALFELKEVINAHVRSTAETIIHKMDLVTREEFDTQLLVLRRAQEKLAKIEESVKEMIEHANVSEQRNAQMKKTTPQLTSQAREIGSESNVNTSKQTKKSTTNPSTKTRKASNVEKSEKSKKVVATKKSTRKKTTNKNSD